MLNKYRFARSYHPCSSMKLRRVRVEREDWGAEQTRWDTESESRPARPAQRCSAEQAASSLSPLDLVLTVRRLPRLLLRDCSGSSLPSGLLQWVILCQVPYAVLLIWSHCKPCDALWQLDSPPPRPVLFEKNRNEQNRRGPRPLQVQLEAASTAMPYYSQRLTPSKLQDQGPKGPAQLLVTCCFFRIPSQSIIKWKQSKKTWEIHCLRL